MTAAMSATTAPGSPARRSRSRSRSAVAVATAALAVGGSLLGSAGSASAAPSTGTVPGDLLISRLHYTGTAGMIVPGQTVLPTGVTAVADGSFAHVWDNADVDPNFGVTAPILLDEMTPSGAAVATLAVPTGTPVRAGRAMTCSPAASRPSPKVR